MNRVVYRKGARIPPKPVETVFVVHGAPAGKPVIPPGNVENGVHSDGPGSHHLHHAPTMVHGIGFGVDDHLARVTLERMGCREGGRGALRFV